MYRKKDFDLINLNIDKIKSEAIEKYKTLYEPTYKEMTLVYNLIKNYIIKTNKIVYGGIAQNLFIKQKNPKDVFYKEINGVFYNWPNLADIEFYSFNPIQDAVNITELLLKSGFKNIEAKEGVHPDTYKLFINFINYCDISYLPIYIYNNLPTQIINNMRCTNIYFMLADSYRVLTDPLTSYWRLDKTINRSQLLLTYYPFKKIIKNIDSFNIFKSNNNIILKFIRKKIIHSLKLIVVGYYAYNYYSKKVSKNLLLHNIPYYEAISEDLNKTGKYIYKILIKKYGNNISTKEYFPFFLFIDKKIEYYYKQNLIFILYGNNNRCTVYNFSKKKNTYFGTFNLVLMYMLFNYIYYTINKYKNADLFLLLINKLIEIRNIYLNKHNISVLDKSPFYDFTINCIGTTIDPIRLSLIEKKKKFKYTPSGKPIEINYKFNNISGNQILNKKYLILKNNI